MACWFARVGALLVVSLLAACGSHGEGASAIQATAKPYFPDGGGAAGRGGTSDGDLGGGFGGPRWSGPPTPTVPAPPITFSGRVEESESTAVKFSPGWSAADSRFGWSGGSALQSSTAGASVSFTFVGTSVRWIGSRGRAHGIAQVAIDGVQVREVDLFARPTDAAHTPVVTLYDLPPGQHTLTITVTGRANVQAQGANVVVDAFDVQPDFTVSHWQDSNPGYTFTSGWVQSPDGGYWSGGGVSNLPELPMTAHEASAANETMTIPFRGTGIHWIGYRGPDAGIAHVQLDGGPLTEIDLYSPTRIWQPVVFTANGLADGDHILKIHSTGRRNAAATGSRVVVDALDVITPGRRYEDYELTKITYTGKWVPDNLSRAWSEGKTATSNTPGSTASFTFSGSSVSWISCQKGSAAGVSKVYIDGVFVKEVRNNQNYPIEGYQMTVFRADNLGPGAHTLTIEVINTNGAYVVVDAFDVRP